jgi:RNA polymerase sigma-70 factor (ECF subfamily)
MDVKGRTRPGVTPGPQGSRFPAPLSAEQVYRDYATRVYHTARRMLRSDLDAEDVTQDVLLQVVRNLPTFRGDSAFPTWLHRVTINAALLFRRRAARTARTVAEPLDDLPGETGPQSAGRHWLRGPVSQLVERETRFLLDRAIAGLPDGYREVLEGADIEGLPNQTIADQMGLSLPALKSRLHRARLMLRDALEPHFGERQRPYPARAGA